MKMPRVSASCFFLSGHLVRRQRLVINVRVAKLARELHAARSSMGSGNSDSSKGNIFLVPGATVATILMLGFLHARRLYDDKKVEDKKEKGIEQEFSPDLKAKFLRLLPLRSISRFWGLLSSLEIPVSLRPSIYKAWARAFHANLEEAALPLEEYTTLQEFFVRRLKDGSRPINPDLNCLVSPVDGLVLQCGELRGPGALIEQVKGFSYSAYSLLGATTSLHEVVDVNILEENSEHKSVEEPTKRSWWRVSLASPKVRHTVTTSPRKGVFYCVLYLRPGDYHRIHSPIDWQVFRRRHFPAHPLVSTYGKSTQWCDATMLACYLLSGHLFPLNERARRTIRNLHIENERVVLEGQWREGFLAMAAIGATNIGSIKLFIEPELHTNRPKRLILHSEAPDEKTYEPEGIGVRLKKGEEVGAFNLGSTVVLVFQAPISAASSGHHIVSSDFNFCIRSGDRVKVGEAIGRWL